MNVYFDELDMNDYHYLGITLSYGQLSTPGYFFCFSCFLFCLFVTFFAAQIGRFPLCLVRCDPNESLGLECKKDAGNVCIVTYFLFSWQSRPRYSRGEFA